MVDIYYTTSKVDTQDYIKYILERYYNIPNAIICKTINGKPYLKGDKIFFNASHSKDILALAVGKSEIGLDCEALNGKPRPAVLNKFSEREKEEIFSTSDFYEHWTVRESFVKFLGGTLSSMWRKIEFVNGNIYFLNKKENVRLLRFQKEGYTFSVCGNYTKYSFKKVDLPN